jgi:hypothetical protein
LEQVNLDSHSELGYNQVIVSSILDHMLQPATDQMPPDFARKLLDLRASPELLARIENLRAKANTGKISQEEELEYKEFVEAIDIISLLQSKARKILADKLMAV